MLYAPAAFACLVIVCIHGLALWAEWKERKAISKFTAALFVASLTASLLAILYT